MNRFLVATLGLLGAVGLAQASVPVTHSAAGHPANIVVPAATTAVLYDQMDAASGGNVSSQDFEAANAAFTDQAADDFVVPAGRTWSVTGVDVVGDFTAVPATAFNVYFYQNAAATPSFAAQQPFATGTNPYLGTTADVNGDGKPDLIVANWNDNTVSVLLNITAPGATTPSFAVQQTFATGTNPDSVTTADVNGDGKPDLIVTNYTDNTVSVLLNTTAPGATTASFAAQQPFATGTNPFSVTAADVNGDGKPDLIVANIDATPSTVSVLLNTTATGDTTPSFAAQQTFATGSIPPFVTAADVNGDGKPDLIVANWNANTVSVLLNTTAPGATTASFAAQQTFATGMNPNSVTVADVNGDGKPDLIVANQNANTVSVLLNTTAPGATTASFAAQQTFATGTRAQSVTAADVNGDGKPDLIVANMSDNTVSVLLNTTVPGAATPSFAAQLSFATGAGPLSVTTADVNGDGKPDLIVTNLHDSTVSVLLNTTAAGLPGTLVTSALSQTYTGGAASGDTAVITLATPVSLPAGSYWVSVQARLDSSGGQWFWANRSTQSNSPAAWQNPGDALVTGCTTWGVKTTCLGATQIGADQLFRLNGTGTGPPTITKAFVPASVAVGVSSTLTITLSNSNATAATLSADLVDTFPAGLVVAATPNAATTCSGGAGVTTGTGSVTLGTGAQIPAAGSCTISVDVSSATAASYANSIAIGALQTDAGNNAASADATLTVTSGAGSGCDASTTGIIIHDDGQAENGYGWQATVTDGRFAEKFTPTSYPATFSSACFSFISNSGITSLNFDIVVYAPDGAGGSPGTVLGTQSVTGTVAAITGIPFTPTFESFDISGMALNIASGDVYIGATWVPSTVGAGLFVSADESTATPIEGGYAWANAGPWQTTQTVQPGYRALMIRAVAGSPGPGAPSVSKAFAPAVVTAGAVSTLTITLSNISQPGAATLTAVLTDTFPTGVVVAATPNAATTCTAGTVTATAGSGSVALNSGAAIPAAGTCTVTVDVSAAAAGIYVNTLPAGALHTDQGDNVLAASATLTVTPVVVPPPVVVVTPAALSFTLQAGASGTDPLNIANTGGSDLTFSVSEGTSSIHKPTSYKTSRDSKVVHEQLAKFGPGSLAQNTLARNHAVGQPVALAPTDISQMADNSPGDQGVSCGVQGTSTADNSWWRRFYFSEYPGVGASMNVNSVTISSGSTGPTGLPITINLYTIPHGTPIDTIPTASLTLIGSGTGTIDSGLLSVTIPVSGAVADTVGTDLVVEYHTDGNVSGGQFYPGANATAETHPTFISSTTCSIPEPATAASIGFPDFHLTMIVSLGDATLPTCANQADIPWLSEAPVSGTVVAGASTDVTVTADATTLIAGNYTANVCVGSNDPVTPLVTVPVTLTVTPAPFVPCNGGTSRDEIFCDGFEMPAGGAGTYTDRTTFLTHVAAGFYENPFNDAVPGPSPPLNYTNGSFAYTVDASSPAPAGGLYNDTGLISTNVAADSIVVTFTGSPITAVGGNFWASDINMQPTGTVVTILLSDGTTVAFTSTGPADFRGFTTALPITSITIDALDVPNPAWPTMDNLIIGTSN